MGDNNPFDSAMVRRASTGPNGVPLQNGTPTILSWIAPNDGKLHRVSISARLEVAQATTGGEVDATVGPFLFGLWLGTQGAGFISLSSVQQIIEAIAKPGETVSILQTTAMTAGAATLFAEIWGS